MCAGFQPFPARSGVSAVPVRFGGPPPPGAPHWLRCKSLQNQTMYSGQNHLHNPAVPPWMRQERLQDQRMYGGYNVLRPPSETESRPGPERPQNQSFYDGFNKLRGPSGTAREVPGLPFQPKQGSPQNPTMYAGCNHLRMLLSVGHSGPEIPSWIRPESPQPTMCAGLNHLRPPCGPAHGGPRGASPIAPENRQNQTMYARFNHLRTPIRTGHRQIEIPHWIRQESPQNQRMYTGFNSFHLPTHLQAHGVPVVPFRPRQESLQNQTTCTGLNNFRAPRVPERAQNPTENRIIELLTKEFEKFTVQLKSAKLPPIKIIQNLPYLPYGYEFIPLIWQTLECQNVVKQVKNVGMMETIYRINNPLLRALYELKKSETLRNCPQSREVHLFHGTKVMHLHSICQTNLNRRLCKESFYGHGVYFCRNSSFALHYCDKFRFGRMMLLCKVLLGKGSLGNTSTTIPDPGCDYTHNGKHTIFVKYDDDTYYPEYLITFNC